MKAILAGFVVAFLNFSAFAQIEKPKPGGTTTTKPKTTTATTPVSKGVATVEVTWKGPGAVKIFIGTNEFFLIAGGKNTIKLNAGETYSPKVVSAGSVEHTCSIDKRFIPKKGIGYLELSLYYDGSINCIYISENQKRDAAILDSLNNIEIKKQERDARIRDSIQLQKTLASEKAHIYKTVTIGSLIWHAENLNLSTFRNGDFIPEAKTREEWDKAGIEGKPAWCYYDNDPANASKYGKLYNWYAVTDPRGLAPIGWHIPSKSECSNLEINLNETNSSGFALLFGGQRHKGTFIYEGEKGSFWSSTINDTDTAFFLTSVTDYKKAILTYDRPKSNGYSVRCVKD